MNVTRSSFAPLLRVTIIAVSAVLLTLGVLVLSGTPVFPTVHAFISGALGSTAAIGRTISGSVPLIIASSALMITFACGLWNIGIEGQIAAGAVCTTGMLRCLPSDAGTGGIILGVAAGAAGGALWALFAGIMRVRGGVHEIFSGLGLNFVASGLVLWLIFGPWKRPGIASMSGTELLPESFRLYASHPLSVVPCAAALACIVWVAVAWILKRSWWGLAVQAVGQNSTAARIMGLSPDRRILQTLALSGCLGGIVGALQVVAVYHQLNPSIAGGYGYAALLVALAISPEVLLIPPVCFFFAALTVGAIQLPLRLGIDSSLCGVLQGVLVLSVFLVQGLERLVRRGKEAA